MKMYAFYSVNDIPNLEYNHKKYCDIHKIEYNKIIVSESLAEKYAHVLTCLQNNKEQTLIFIDDLSFFKSLNYFPNIKNDIYFQNNGNIILDNFFIVKSNEQTIRTFHDIYQNISKNTINVKRTKTKEEVLFEKLKDVSIQYPARDEGGIYQNIVATKHANGFEISNCFVSTFKHEDFIFWNPYFAESICESNIKDFSIPVEPYECLIQETKMLWYYSIRQR